MSIRQRNEDELRVLWAVRTALAGIPTPGGKGKHLQQAVKGRPRLYWYLLLVYSPAIKPPITALDVLGPGEVVVPPDFTHKSFTKTLIKWSEYPPTKQIAFRDFHLMTGHLQPELQELARDILDKDLRCGLSLRVVNRVFRNLGYSEIEEQEPNHTPRAAAPASIFDEKGMSVEFYTGTADYAHGDIRWDGIKVGTMSFLIGPGMRKVVTQLRAAGITIHNRPEVKQPV